MSFNFEARKFILQLVRQGGRGVAQASPCLVVLIRLLTFHVAANYASMSMTRERRKEGRGGGNRTYYNGGKKFSA